MSDLPDRPLALAEDLLKALHQSPLPFALVDVHAMTVIDMNAPARDVLAWDSREPKEMAVTELVPPDQVPVVLELMHLLEDGSLDTYEARRKILRLDGEVLDCHTWVHSARDIMRFAAVVIFAPDHHNNLAPSDFDLATASFRPIAVGSLDLELRVTRISADTQDLIGRRADSLTGMSFVELVHPDDVASFLMAVGRALSHGSGVGLRLRVSDGTGAWARVRVLITPLRGGSSAHLGIVMSAAHATDDEAERAADLEQRLWRIALEVQAAGVMDAMHTLPEHPQLPPAQDLSSRQWEVLARLQRGERVPGIAREMFLSQSTVRNHLAAIFRKTGVHSQADLLAMLRENRQSV
jgi:DNA-binding CsgD family transcriptional regulator/PAS domain-containing protein